jgi:MFS transporter, DHA1 family, multidrug resistance protein
MKLRPDTLGMTAMLAMLTALSPLSTDLYLPSLPAIARALGTDAAGVQLTLSAYLVGYAVGQIFYGPLSDRIGRKPTVAAGLIVYCLASVACAAAQSIDFLVAMRFVQALGAAGPIVLGRAIVRDLYDGSRAGRELSRMGMLMGLVPAVAPVLGGVLEPLFGWRSNFWVTALGAGALCLCFMLMMPETLRERRPESLSILSIFRGFGTLLRNPGYRLYVMLNSFTYAGLFSFISASSFVMQGVYGMSPLGFGLSFGFAVLGFIAGTILAQRLVTGRGLDGTIRPGVWCMAAGGVLMLLLMAFGGRTPLEAILPMALYSFGVGLVMPQTNASAMMPFPDRAGAASSLLGLIQMSFSAIAGLLLAILLVRSPLAMPAFIAAMGLAALIMFSLARPAAARVAEPG